MESNANRCISRVPGFHAAMPPYHSVASRSLSLPDTTVESADGLIRKADHDSSW